MPKTETGMVVELVPNNPNLDLIKVKFDRYIDREPAVAGWLAGKMAELGHPEQFSSRELLEAPWAPTQTSLFDKTAFCSLREWAVYAKRIYDWQH